uniref:Uncharacterized protein n=1 Tax=Lotharella oceanica TaxID=641309 RepID=A0A7S2U3Z2_9EUKA
MSSLQSTSRQSIRAKNRVKTANRLARYIGLMVICFLLQSIMFGLSHFVHGAWLLPFYFACSLLVEVCVLTIYAPAIASMIASKTGSVSRTRTCSKSNAVLRSSIRSPAVLRSSIVLAATPMRKDTLPYSRKSLRMMERISMIRKTNVTASNANVAMEMTPNRRLANSIANSSTNRSFLNQSPMASLAFDEKTPRKEFISQHLPAQQRRGDGDYTSDLKLSSSLHLDSSSAALAPESMSSVALTQRRETFPKKGSFRAEATPVGTNPIALNNPLPLSSTPRKEHSVDSFAV